MDLLKHIVDEDPGERPLDAEPDIFEVSSGMGTSHTGKVTRTGDTSVSESGTKTVHFSFDDQDLDETQKHDHEKELDRKGSSDDSSSLTLKTHRESRHRHKERRHKPHRDAESKPTSDNGSHDVSHDGSTTVGLDDTIDSSGTDRPRGKSRRKKGKHKSRPDSDGTVDPLVVKYYELNEILKRDFIERKQLHGHQQSQHLQHMFHCYVEAVCKCPPPAPCVQKGVITNTTKRLVHYTVENVLQSNPSEKDDVSHTISVKLGQSVEGNGRSEGSTIRNIPHAVKKTRPQSAVVSRPSRSKTSNGKLTVGRRSRSAGSGGSSGPIGRRRRSLDSPTTEAQSSVKSHDNTVSTNFPGRSIVPTDCFLKNTDDENIHEWLAKKKRLVKMERAAKRAKRHELRAAQMDEATRRYDRGVLSKLETDEWMERKRKQAWRKVKEDKIKQTLAEKEKAEELELKRRKLNKLHEKLCNPPVLMVHHKRDKKEQSAKMNLLTIDIQQLQGGETSADVRHQLETDKLKKEGEQLEKAAKIHEGIFPPKTKFIYKRPVTGKIRFKMPKGKSADENKQANGREKNNIKNRMSYDQWLLRKRVEDAERRKIEQAKCRNLAGSDSELERILPEIAKRRIEKISEQKKRINTGVKHIDYNLNAAFGSGDRRQDSNQTDCDRLNRLHSVKAQSNTPTQPKISFNSPRRATTRLEVVMEREEVASPYKLPFPPDQGAPRHVAAKQRKLFADRIWKSQDEERPEPQGCEPSAPTTEHLSEKTTPVINVDPFDKPLSESSPHDDDDGKEETKSGRYGFRNTEPSDSDSSIGEEIAEEKNLNLKDHVIDANKQNDSKGNATTDHFFLTSIEV